MRPPYPAFFFQQLLMALPGVPLWGWRAVGGGFLLAAATAIALHHLWVGAPLLVVGLLAATAGEVQARMDHKRQVPVLTLGLLALLLGFGLAEPDRALAAMFLMFGLTVMTVLGGSARDGVVAVIWLAAAVFLLACFLPSSFSLSAYLIGVIAIIVTGQGAAKDWS